MWQDGVVGKKDARGTRQQKPPPQTKPPGSLEDGYPMLVRIEGKPIALPQTPKQSGTGNTYWTYGGLRWNNNAWHMLPHL